MLHEGHRVARYTEPGGGAAPELRLTRVDDADITTAAALVVRDGGKGHRYLLAPGWPPPNCATWPRPTPRPAPWTATGPASPAVPAPAGDCSSRPALQLRSSSVVAEKHAFLLTDLGDLSPVHLTFTPPPGHVPARSPREATGQSALVDWARTACGLSGSAPGAYGR
ncbi:hypothetical protein NKH77_06645 [Streptomyces sp. M19]